MRREHERGQVVQFATRGRSEGTAQKMKDIAKRQAEQRRMITVPSLAALYDEDATTLGSGTTIASYRRSLEFLSEEERMSRLADLEDHLFWARKKLIDREAQTLDEVHMHTVHLARHAYMRFVALGSDSHIQQAEEVMERVFGRERAQQEMATLAQRLTQMQEVDK